MPVWEEIPKHRLGIISFAENAIMALMGGALIYSAATTKVESAKIKQIEPHTVVELQEART